ncbi:dTMP kinase [candidate division WOR-1 bacterium RIFOXYB2_FULL_48_7]|uniref:Thymidylate kinase n=1 Tax=candidate division WOR-1 bacterium RIFOXYB2_FULL_48_7 TaxID=1802583 RepID=A0A1F4TMF8_UNCSA|nr:MAG: dTMP kinase [candidate division WOR-1 bacterium RIFOXYB2_FULL_48_7]
MFITFEGPEGCGKSTHAKRLKTYLEGKGLAALLTQEPGGTQVGKEIRQFLLKPENVLDDATEVYLFAADRSEHVSKIIQPALADHKAVISDRFIDSTIAYQIGGRGLPEDLVRYINMVSSKGLLPDLTLLLDVSPETGLQRAAQKGLADRIEKETLAFHQRVRAKYLEIARYEPGRVKLINTEHREIDEIQAEIRRLVDEKLGNQG